MPVATAAKADELKLVGFFVAKYLEPRRRCNRPTHDKIVHFH